MKKFEKYSATPENPKWEQIISRETPLYKRDNDIRDEFERDYGRIIHCNAYRRLKHKTQVFFSPENDHICTRIEHVTHVESISHTIAKYLGLNTELTKAIAVAHDLGHSPFGHEGEHILSEISKRIWKYYQKFVLEKKDRRMKTTTQAFQMIKIVKLYSSSFIFSIFFRYLSRFKK